MPSYRIRKRKSAPIKRVGSTKRFQKTVARTYVKRRRTALQTGKMTYMRARNVQIIPVVLPTNPSGPAGAVDQIRMPIAWQRPSKTQVPANTVYNIRDATPFSADGRFIQCYENWKQYAIKGVKIEYMPRSNIAGGDEIGTSAMYTMSGLQNLDKSILKDTTPSLMQEPAFKALNPRRPYKKFISCKSISKQEHLDWQDCTEFNPAVVTDYTSGPLSEAWSMLMWDLTKARPATDPVLNLGSVKLTWFITFRGQES